ncbi:ankyrin repeat-containing domain protein [Microdochium trichocladiopsis]|uniref:Ankyrin repeat-containing domain protein n=1 Tax=Microdochium trichocladiopsis TaxID=1682393 RepID=A0A9P9BLD0_9PEZI|nr:ankyrin repeat-containing domain protein [Microdochium trichocladiopsis]KAH7027952.1 ankyrin repeat-containing domain protein [Microdochium trichocladiopsis]
MNNPSKDQLKSAAATGDTAHLREYFLAHKPSIPPETAQELLKAAVVGCHTSVVDFLLNEFPQLELSDETVHAAACKASIPVLSQLIARDPSLANRRLERIGTPLSSACRSRRSIEFLRYLLEQGADPNKRPESFGFPIALAATRYDDTAAIDLFLGHGARLEHSGALGAAAGQGNDAMMRYLLSKGAAPDNDARELAGEHPLHSALMAGQVGAARILLDHGASINVVDRSGKSLAEVADLLESKGEDRAEFKALLSKVREERSKQ